MTLTQRYPTLNLFETRVKGSKEVPVPSTDRLFSSMSSSSSSSSSLPSKRQHSGGSSGSGDGGALGGKPAVKKKTNKKKITSSQQSVAPSNAASADGVAAPAAAADGVAHADGPMLVTGRGQGMGGDGVAIGVPGQQQAVAPVNKKRPR